MNSLHPPGEKWKISCNYSPAVEAADLVSLWVLAAPPPTLPSKKSML